MQNLKELLAVLPSKKIFGKTDLDIGKIEYDSRKIDPGDLFVAIPGFREDGHEYINSALEKGAVAVVAQRDGPYEAKVKIIVPDTREALALLTCKFFDYPSEKLKVVGITGTNGKTTITYLVKSILEKEGKKTGLIGTIAYFIGEEKLEAINTTPESLDLQQMFSQMLGKGTDSVVMEVSSHALTLKRVIGVDFDVAVFTNLNREHLDFHKTLSAYKESKGLLFEMLSNKNCAVINIDDPSWRYFYDKAKTNRLTYSLHDERADLYAKSFLSDLEGSQIDLLTPNGRVKINLKLLGELNIYNALASAAVGVALNANLETIKSGLESVEGIPGRMEKIQTGQDFNILIDYAHTPYALGGLLKTVRRLTKGDLLVLFGCGGDRDQGKRPQMGEVASLLADRVFLTEDNPRSEDPKRIIDQIMQGVKNKEKVEIIIDRKEGIKKALNMVKRGDSLVLAGKGHENYQIKKDRKFHFSDKETVLELLEQSAVGSPQTPDNRSQT
ncbi:MAG: UDP-N-acetylmuramoyl-L-alanyl-D-glutamate--2,6-diaminopimelate ligase [Candidatus Zixiibacteriota bacterium]